jgi:hypothetical protein
VTKAASGGRAIQRAVTRVKFEQASKESMQTDPSFARGRPRGQGSNRHMHLFGLPGYWTRHVGTVMRVIGGDPSRSKVAASTSLMAMDRAGVGQGRTTVEAGVMPAEERTLEESCGESKPRLIIFEGYSESEENEAKADLISKGEARETDLFLSLRAFGGSEKSIIFQPIVGSRS